MKSLSRHGVERAEPSTGTRGTDADAWISTTAEESMNIRIGSGNPVVVSAACSRGRRDYQEDRFAVYADRDRERVVIAVFDGVSQGGGGGAASAAAAEAFARTWLESVAGCSGRDNARTFSEALNAANGAVEDVKEMHPEYYVCATTVTAVLVEPDAGPGTPGRYSHIWMGDSPLYYQAAPGGPAAIAAPPHNPPDNPSLVQSCLDGSWMRRGFERADARDGRRARRLTMVVGKGCGSFTPGALLVAASDGVETIAPARACAAARAGTPEDAARRIVDGVNAENYGSQDNTAVVTVQHAAR